MTHPTIYEICGLRLRSPWELALPVTVGHAWDVDFVAGPQLVGSTDRPAGEVIAALDRDDDWWYTATSTGDGFHLRFRGCAEFQIAPDLSRVEVRVEPTGPGSLVPVLIAGTVSAFLLTLRGETVLHASAVAVGGVTIAFVGPSGQGKSTVAALMCKGGALLVTDDVLAVHAGDVVTCTGGAAALRLRRAAATLAESDASMTADDRLAMSAAQAPRGPRPLAAIVIPQPSREVAEIEVERLSPSDALFAMLAIPRIYGWCEPTVLARDFATLAAVVNAVAVHRVTIPWGPPFDPAVAETLAALVTASSPHM